VWSVECEAEVLVRVKGYVFRVQGFGFRV